VPDGHRLGRRKAHVPDGPGDGRAGEQGERRLNHERQDQPSFAATVALIALEGPMRTMQVEAGYDNLVALPALVGPMRTT
jgi:hypothetical protein